MFMLHQIVPTVRISLITSSSSQDMKSIAGFDERNSSRNGLGVRRDVHRVIDAGLAGKNPTTLCVHLGCAVLEHPRMTDLHLHLLVCSENLIADEQGDRFPSHEMLLFGWHYFLQKDILRRDQHGNKPLFCVVCGHAWGRAYAQEYGFHHKMRAYADKHEEIAPRKGTIPIKEWYGIGCDPALLSHMPACTEEDEEEMSGPKPCRCTTGKCVSCVCARNNRNSSPLCNCKGLCPNKHNIPDNGSDGKE
jgi:hypothetical protein